LICQK